MTQYGGFPESSRDSPLIAQPENFGVPGPPVAVIQGWLTGRRIPVTESTVDIFHLKHMDVTEHNIQPDIQIGKTVTEGAKPD